MEIKKKDIGPIPIVGDSGTGDSVRPVATGSAAASLQGVDVRDDTAAPVGPASADNHIDATNRRVIFRSLVDHRHGFSVVYLVSVELATTLHPPRLRSTLQIKDVIENKYCYRDSEIRNYNPFQSQVLPRSKLPLLCGSYCGVSWGFPDVTKNENVFIRTTREPMFESDVGAYSLRVGDFVSPARSTPGHMLLLQIAGSGALPVVSTISRMILHQVNYPFSHQFFSHELLSGFR